MFRTSTCMRFLFLSCETLWKICPSAFEYQQASSVSYSRVTSTKFKNMLIFWRFRIGIFGACSCESCYVLHTPIILMCICFETVFAIKFSCSHFQRLNEPSPEFFQRWIACLATQCTLVLLNETCALKVCSLYVGRCCCICVSAVCTWTWRICVYILVRSMWVGVHEYSFLQYMHANRE